MICICMPFFLPSVAVRRLCGACGSFSAHRTVLCIVGQNISVKGLSSMSMVADAIFVPMEHDASYKLLFAHVRMVEDLLRGFVHEATDETSARKCREWD